MLLVAIQCCSEAQVPVISKPVPSYLICNLKAWFCGVGISLSLILSTLFVKMLRVYAIFLNPYSYKKKFYTDSFLFLYIILIVSPHVLILILWSALDPLNNHEFVISTKSHILVLGGCFSNYTETWILILGAYVSTLVLALVILAFKSSKVQYKNFRDTKATNAFAFLTLFLVFICILYWFFFQNIEVTPSNRKAAEITLHIGHIAIANLCQIFLFIPKVIPPLKRHLHGNAVKNKPHSTGSTTNTTS